MVKMKERFKSISSRNGAMSLGMVAIVVCIVIVVNLIMGQLPENIRKLDLSDNKLYEISDVSREMLDGLDKKIEMKVLAVKESADDRIKTFISKYASLSSKIDVEWIDPILHPSALTEYETEGNSIVVTCPDTEKTTTVSFNDILVMDEMSYYTTGSTSPTAFDGEGQLTAAINYVSSDATKKIYTTAGHGEGSLGTSVTDLMDKMNLSTEELNLLIDGKIPDDCDLLMMYAPTKDLTEEESKALTEYLEKGGKVFMILGASEERLPNLEKIMKTYGMEMEDGYIADTQRCYQGNYYYIFPELTVSGDLAAGLESQMVLLVNSMGMNQTDPERDTITVSPFMSTSSDGHAVTSDGETQGTYVLGATATETIGASEEESENTDETGEKESRLTVITAPAMVDPQITGTFTTLENLTLFMNAVTANFDDVQNVAVEAKSLEITYNTMQHAGLISVLIIFGIPIIILCSGFAVWWRRRRA